MCLGKKNVSVLRLDLRIAHDRFGSSSDPTLNGTLHYPNPNDIVRSLNEVAADKIRKYRTDYNNNPPNVISFIPTVLVPHKDYIVNLLDFYSYRFIGKLTAFLQLQEFSKRNQTWGHRTSTFAAPCLFDTEVKMRKYSCQGICFTY